MSEERRFGSWRKEAPLVRESRESVRSKRRHPREASETNIADIRLLLMSSPEPVSQHGSSPEEVASQTSLGPTNRWSKYVTDVGHVFNVTLRNSYANYLLPVVALGIVAGKLSWNSAAVFILNFLAIFPLASLLSYSTEELSASVGQTVGGLINATFGNAVELIVCYLATTVHLFLFHFC